MILIGFPRDMLSWNIKGKIIMSYKKKKKKKKWESFCTMCSQNCIKMIKGDFTIFNKVTKKNFSIFIIFGMEH